jgi:uncharacterized protein (TIGR02246 family)
LGQQEDAMNSDEQEIRQLVETWMSATKAGDTAKALSLMADDVVFLRPGHEPMVGKAAFTATAQPQSGQSPPKFDGTSEVQEVKVLGDWAFMWSRLKVVATMPDGKTNTRTGHTLSILKKQNGKWLLARDANMLA